MDNPTLMRRLHGWLTVSWLLLIPIAYVAGWFTSVPFVSALSLYAIVTGHWASWQASRVEEKQDEAQQ